MGIIAFLIFGGLVGWLASMIMGTDAQQGILMNIIVGIIGAFIGGLLGATLLGRGIGNFFDIWSWILAIVGAVLLIWLVRLFTGRRV